jgi:acyl-CoA thioester hydrolase
MSGERGDVVSQFVVPIRPRYAEVDSMGIVYHGNYLVYFDVGRTEWLRAAGSDYAELERRGYRLAVVDAALQYRRPAHFDEPLSLAVSVEQVGRATVTFRYELRSLPGELLVTGHTRLGCLDTRHRPTALPEDTLACLRRGMQGAGRPSEDS